MNGSGQLSSPANETAEIQRRRRIVLGIGCWNTRVVRHLRQRKRGRRWRAAIRRWCTVRWDGEVGPHRTFSVATHLG